MPSLTPEPQQPEDMSFLAPESLPPADETPLPKFGDETQAADDNEDARLFFERLEQTGQLVDVDASSDINKLPPKVTHVRHPDGTIERIGFS